MNSANRILCVLLAALLLAGQARAAVVLQYHHIGLEFPASTSVSLERFQQHMDYLQQQDFKVVPLVSLVNTLRAGKPLPDRTVAITFDDAYQSVYERAAPLLAERNWPYTVFVSSGAVDGGYQGVMSWQQLRQLAGQGADMANHTVSHRHLVRRLSGETRQQWQQRVLTDIRQAEQRIAEELGQSHKLLAFPYGEYNLELLQLLQGEGFAGVGQQSGPMGSWMDVRLLPRFPFAGHYGDPGDFAIKVNSLPLPVTALSLDGDDFNNWVEPVLSGPASPELHLQLDWQQFAGIRCFASGQGEIGLRKVAGTLIVEAPVALPSGRSRYNCTAPAGSGRFYWFSQLFIVPMKNGQWYQEH